MIEPRSILVIAPHPDDEAIGCGGAILLHVQRGDRVEIVFLTSGELGLKHLSPGEAWSIRESEAEASGRVLGVHAMHFLRLPDWFLGDNVDTAAMALEPILKALRPSVAYAPHQAEWHPDHKASLPILRAATRFAGIDIPETFLYEIWTPIQEFEHVEDISKVMASKVRAIRKYRSQLSGFAYDQAAYGINLYRGALAGHCRFAEVFAFADMTDVHATSTDWTY